MLRAGVLVVIMPSLLRAMPVTASWSIFFSDVGTLANSRTNFRSGSRQFHETRS